MINPFSEPINSHWICKYPVIESKEMVQNSFAFYIKCHYWHKLSFVTVQLNVNRYCNDICNMSTIRTQNGCCHIKNNRCVSFSIVIIICCVMPIKLIELLKFVCLMLGIHCCQRDKCYCEIFISKKYWRLKSWYTFLTRSEGSKLSRRFLWYFVALKI